MIFHLVSVFACRSDRRPLVAAAGAKMINKDQCGSEEATSNGLFIGYLLSTRILSRLGHRIKS